MDETFLVEKRRGLEDGRAARHALTRCHGGPQGSHSKNTKIQNLVSNIVVVDKVF
jgi:hypothetical protein